MKMKLLSHAVITQLKNFQIIGLHNGFVTINKEKMSKSLGNIVTISDAVKKIFWSSS